MDAGAEVRVCAVHGCPLVLLERPASEATANADHG
jgi:hypothetical protein